LSFGIVNSGKPSSGSAKVTLEKISPKTKLNKNCITAPHQLD